MEETLGKRIAAHRRRLGLTQDRLAELLGVTAQAVSKWENDQSCPDITMLPKLAEIFSCTTDQLLGIQKEAIHEAELILSLPEEPKTDHQEDTVQSIFNGEIGVKKKTGRKSGILMALWVLLTGGLLFLPNTNLWTLLWTTGLLLFGISGLWPRFSFFCLGCALFGGYCLLNHLTGVSSPPLYVRRLLLPAFLLLFGLHLLAETLRKPGRHRRHIIRPDSLGEHHCDLGEEAFDCSASFGENHYRIDLPRLSRGKAEVSFGDLTVDLSGCEEIGDNCLIDLDASFGNLELIIPQGFRAIPDTDTAFGNVEIIGSPAPDAQCVFTVRCDASFGQISLHYI